MLRFKKSAAVLFMFLLIMSGCGEAANTNQNNEGSPELKTLVSPSSRWDPPGVPKGRKCFPIGKETLLILQNCRLFNEAKPLFSAKNHKQVNIIQIAACKGYNLYYPV